MNALILLLLGFAGYVLGRIGHIFGGQIKGPHHWIYGAILIAVAILLSQKIWAGYVFFFGFGVVISDLKDLLDVKIYGVDDVKIKKFWGID